MPGYGYGISNVVSSSKSAARGGGVIPFENTKSLVFDGVDDYLTVPIFTTSGDDLTISFWFKDGGGSGSQYILAGDGNNVVYHPSNTVFYAKINGTLAYIQTDSGGVPAILDGNWHHIAITKSGSTVTWWFDGGSYTTLGGGTTGGFTLTNIGSYITPSAYITGNLDEIGIWNSDQTSNMATIYGTGVPSSLASLNPVAWWRMGDSSTFKSPQILIPEDTNKDKVSNYSMAFDGVDDYIKAPLDGTSTGGILPATDSDINLTISLWVKIDTSATSEGILQWANTLTDGSPFLFIQQDSLNVRVFVDNGYRGDTAFSLDTWYNIIVTRTSSTNIWEGYLNGVSWFTYDDGGSLFHRASATDIWLGNSWGGFVNGSIDEASIFDSVQDVSTIYNSGTPNDITSLSPVAYWKLGEQARYNGTDWLIPNSISSNYSNFSFNFDGVDDYATFPSFNSLVSLNSFSISFWAKFTSVGASDIIMMHYSVLGLKAYINSNKMSVGFPGNGSASDFVTSPNVIPTDTWTNYTFTYDNVDLKLYENGVLVQTNNSAGKTYIANTGQNLLMGKYWFGGQFIDGNLSNIAIFNSALSEANILTIYNSGKPADLTSLSPVAWWRLGEDASFSTNWNIPDQIGSNDGTSVNMTNDDLVGDAPGITGSGTSDNMTIEDREGNAPNSDTNALSINMDAADVVLDVP